MAEAYDTLKSTSKDALVARYNEIAKSTALGLQFYREELARREADEQNQRMLEFTRQMRNMTIAITVMTFVVLLLTIANIYLVFR